MWASSLGGWVPPLDSPTINRGWPVRDIGNNEYLQLGRDGKKSSKKGKGLRTNKTGQKQPRLGDKVVTFLCFFLNDLQKWPYKNMDLVKLIII